MDDLLTRQSEIGKSIERMATNFKKDPSSRKAKLEYGTKRIQALEALWAEFELNHSEIEQSEALPIAAKAYFEESYYEQVRNVCSRLRSWLADLDTVSNGKATPIAGTSKTVVRQVPDPTPPSTLEHLIRRQRAMQKSVEMFLNEINQELNNAHLYQYYQIKLDRLLGYEEDLKNLDALIWEHACDDTPLGYEVEQYFQLQHQIQRTLIRLQQGLDTTNRMDQQLEQHSVHAPNNNNSRVKLPKIELPHFSGDYLQWTQFHDLYVQLVHTQQISNAEKMFYLINNLNGEPKTLIKHLSVTNNNYETAWNIIVNRYQNKRLLVNAILTKLLNQPTINTESGIAIKRFHDITNECLLGLRNLQIDIDNWDPLLLHILIRKLDKTSHTLYEQGLDKPKEIGSVDNLLHFLEARFQTLEAVSSDGSAKRNQSMTSKSSLSATSKATCILCPQRNHPLYKCNSFLAMKPEHRKKILIDNSLCLNCLKAGHTYSKCMSRGCLKCEKKHNTLIHLEPNKDEQASIISSALNKNCSTTSLAAKDTSLKPGYVLLGTVAVRLSANNGNQVTCRALLDSGSQVSLITESIVRKLAASTVNDSLKVEGIGQASHYSTSRVNVCVQSSRTKASLQVEAFVLPRITGLQPSQYLDTGAWPIPADIQLADPAFNIPTRIDLLIGAEFYHQLMLAEKISMGSDHPILQNTLFGWVVAGKVTSETSKSSVHCTVCSSYDKDMDVSSQIERFWQIEEVNHTESPRTAAEEICERHFKQNTERDTTGRFVVKLPFIEDPRALGDSESLARTRFLGLETRLAKKPELKAQYVEFMQEYIRLNHMREISFNELKKPYCFLPHHFVCKPDSSTTKLRVVFDASAKTTSNVSLNDILAKGPTIQDELFSILMRFRLPRYVFTGDIEKMYRQVRLHPDDQKFHLIYWRNNPEEKLRCYQLTTVTYGTTSAPYLAVKCLKALAKIRAKRYPLGSKSVEQDFYVDDVMTGADDLPTAWQIQSELIELLQEGGFKLRKWCANHPRLLERFQPGDLEVALNFDDQNDESIKTLGLSWSPKSDSFTIKTCISPRNKITKRAAYSDIARIFDPLGILGPVVITAKLLLQQMWAAKSDWDDNLPPELERKWCELREQLQNLNNFSIPRHVFAHQHPKDIQLHSFSDASEKAYGAAVYIRTVTTTNVVLVRLLCAKSRVAPISRVTLPRLELCAAKLAADLCQRVKNDLNLNHAKEFYWTDSEIVLAWVNSKSSSYQTFVANRVAAIQRATNANQWRHVPSKDNPADLLSRGLSPEKLKGNTMWFYGPVFIHGSESVWPSSYKPQEPLLERKKESLSVTIANNPQGFLAGINHGNSFTKLQRIVAYVLRFSRRLQKQHNHQEHLSADELNDSLVLIVKLMQREEFHKDIHHLKKAAEIPDNSDLRGLSPFLDENDIVRVGGRVQDANISYDAKHQMLLPYAHPLTKLLMTDLHIKHHHIGPQTLLSITRQKFWPIKGKVLARSIVHHCVPCSKASPKLLGQKMGNLPAPRVQPSRPFINSGVDFCGPFWTNLRVRGKKAKTYIAIFCCLATKAVHLELVTDLSTDAFIGALRRFISRRGHCQNIYSDNATNFVGARNKLNELHEVVHSKSAKDKITSTCGKNGITFHFIPPRSPHFGGLWEAAVKSAKRLMQNQVNQASLTYEEFETLVVEIEAILNSRPLTAMSADPNDPTALTPGHFLIGEPLTSNVDPEASPCNSRLGARWETVRQQKHEFWRRWSVEYLHELQKRQKWTGSNPNLKPGTLVMIKEDNTTPLQWPMGRVIQVIKGRDDHVRVADIKTKTNIVRRAIHKLAPLPIDNNDEVNLAEANLVGVMEEDLVPTNDHEAEPQPPKRRRTIGSVVSSMLLTCLLVPGVFASSIQVTTFDTAKPSIYFENLGNASIVANEWEILVYYNMTSYWKEYDNLVNASAVLSRLCISLRNSEACSSITRRIQIQLKDIADSDALMLQSSHKQRNKRGAFNFVGNIANSLFGVLDSEYADKMTRVIDDTNNKQHHLLQLLKNHTSILDSTLNVVRETHKHTEEQLNQLVQHINAISEKTNHINQEVQQQHLSATYSVHAIQLLSAAGNFQQLHRALIDTVTDANYGKLNPNILSPHQLQAELSQIRLHLPKTLSLPFAVEEVAKYYKLAKVKTKPGAKYTIFQVNIPLISNEDFELLRIIPVPAIINKTMWKIQPSSPYVIINLHRDQYYPLEEYERHTCNSVDEGIIFCKQRHPIYTIDAGPNKCELNLINQQQNQAICSILEVPYETKWIQLFSANQWLFILKEKTTINVVCSGILTQKVIEGSGIIKIDKGCLIKQPSFMIPAHNIYPSSIWQSYTAVMDFETPLATTTPSYLELQANFSQSTNMLDALKARIQIQQGIEENSNINTHHIHHYVMSYTTLSLALIALVILGWKFKSHINKQQQQLPNSPDFTINNQVLEES